MPPPHHGAHSSPWWRTPVLVLLLLSACVRATAGTAAIAATATNAFIERLPSSNPFLHVSFSGALAVEVFNGTASSFSPLSASTAAVLAQSVSLACPASNWTLHGVHMDVEYAAEGEVGWRLPPWRSLVGPCSIQLDDSAWFGPWPLRRVVDTRGAPLVGAHLPNVKVLELSLTADNTASPMATSHSTIVLQPDEATAFASVSEGGRLTEHAQAIPFLMDILEFMVKLLMPPVFDPFLEDMNDHFSHSLQTEFGNAVVANTPKDTVMQLEPALTRNLTNLLPDSITGSLTPEVVGRMVASIAPPLSARTSELLATTLSSALGDVLADATPTELKVVLPIQLERALSVRLTNTLTSSLTHSLVPTISTVLQPDVVDVLNHPCTRCFLYTDALTSPCPASCADVLYRLESTAYYSAYYGAYYGTYFNVFYTAAIGALDHKMHPPEMRAKAKALNEDGSITETDRRVITASGVRQPVSLERDH